MVPPPRLLSLPRLLICFLALTLTAAAGAAPSELVLHKENTSLYHRPDCPVVRGGEGVIALSRAQAESRGYKPHPDCDPENRKDPTGASPGSAATVPPPVPAVYLDGTKYYHRKDCRRLKVKGRTIQAASLEVAGKSHWPCPACEPPVRRKSLTPAVPGTGRRGR